MRIFFAHCVNIFGLSLLSMTSDILIYLLSFYMCICKAGSKLRRVGVGDGKCPGRQVKVVPNKNFICGFFSATFSTILLK